MLINTVWKTSINHNFSIWFWSGSWNTLIPKSFQYSPGCMLRVAVQREGEDLPQSAIVSSFFQTRITLYLNNFSLLSTLKRAPRIKLPPSCITVAMMFREMCSFSFCPQVAFAFLSDLTTTPSTCWHDLYKAWSQISDHFLLITAPF